MGRVASPWTTTKRSTNKKSTLLFFLTLSAVLSFFNNTPGCSLVTAVAAETSEQQQQQQQQPVIVIQENPQQSVGMEQILDRETYDGAKEGQPDESYHVDSHQGTDPLVSTGEIDADVRAMVRKMTLQELAGQMTQIQIGLLLDKNGELDINKVEYWVGELGVGSFLDTPSNHGGKYISYSAKQFAKIVDGIQRVALSKGRKVPMIYGLDSVHGANYVDGSILFPQQIGVAATFNRTIAYEAGRITAKDTRAAGIPWVFAPILDVAVHKLWPRVYETFGEDPYLVSQMGSSIIKGLQGNYKKDRTRVAACMKHFIGYSASRNGQDKASAWIPDNYLMDYFVPPFKAAVEAGVGTAMETYIDVNGQTIVGSRFYLTELLRERIGFKGMLVTDWQELDRLHTEHRNVKSLKLAAEQSLRETSVDMIMVPESEWFSKEAVTLVRERVLERARLERSVEKVVQLKKDLGLFDQPFSDPTLLSFVGSEQDKDAARDAVRESITVLKNENSVLPLPTNARSGKKILVTGPAANSIRALSGGWSLKWQGAEKEDWYQGRGETILQGLEEEFGQDSVTFAPSVDFDGNTIGSYLDKVKDADTVVLCLGEKPYAEIVGNINNLDLPWGQLEVIMRVTDTVRGTKTRVILVLVEGRPRGLQHWHERVDAIVMAYLPGPWGGRPIAEVLSGRVNPSGRLPMTYPSGAGDMNTNYYRSGVDAYQPLFPFGAGLSYGSVEYSAIELSNSALRTKTRHPKGLYGVRAYDPQEGLSVGVDDNATYVAEKVESSIVARVKVRNTGQVRRKETVMWYVRQEYRSDIMPEALLLKGFEKVELAPGEEREVTFRITREALVYHGRDLKPRVEKGVFTLTVNTMRPEAKSAKFEVI
ncbi:hypothetical protein BGZ94_001217 [Podila epigama]|nr:hypothetical protein BGZ94_001217 [Podila epigama]